MHGPFRGHLMLPRVLVSRCGKNCGCVSRLNYEGDLPLSRRGRTLYHPSPSGRDVLLSFDGLRAHQTPVWLSAIPGVARVVSTRCG